MFEPGAAPVKLTGGFVFTEGPAADPSGNVYFTDKPRTNIWKWSPSSGLSLWRTNSGGANGLFYWTNDCLYACEEFFHRVTRLDAGQHLTVLVSNFNAKPFNTPNDLWVSPAGSIYFTDPYWPWNASPQGVCAVYWLGPGSTTATRVITDLLQPNGIVGTPDLKRLYVADDAGKTTYVYTILTDGTVTNRRVFAPVQCDGMTLDTAGNVYLTDWAGTRNHLVVYDEDGRLLDQLSIPEDPQNVVRGGTDGRTLYVTARTSLYAVRLAAVHHLRQGVNGYTHLATAIAQHAPTSSFTGEPTMPVGILPDQGEMRIVLSFPFTNIPTHHVITNITLKLHTHEASTGLVTRLRLHRLLATPGPDVSWFIAQSNRPWVHPGGDYDPTPLAEIAGPITAASAPLFFPCTTGLLAAANAALAAGEPLNMLLLSDTNVPGALLLASSHHETWLYRPILSIMEMVPEPMAAGLLALALGAPFLTRAMSQD
ncbi:MAG: SMP-30/gluconolactonase/LRE family protein [bacterium]|nr:SMP-30/gluconolactonase/LRE family protein [bacterium]